MLTTSWLPQYKQACLLISDLPAGRAPIKDSALPMRVEARFQDQKSPGWTLQESAITDLTRLDRLLLGLFLALWGVCPLAASSLHHGVLIVMIDATKAFFTDHQVQKLFIAAFPLQEGKTDGCV